MIFWTYVRQSTLLQELNSMDVSGKPKHRRHSILRPQHAVSRLLDADFNCIVVRGINGKLLQPERLAPLSVGLYRRSWTKIVVSKNMKSRNSRTRALHIGRRSMIMSNVGERPRNRPLMLGGPQIEVRHNVTASSIYNLSYVRLFISVVLLSSCSYSIRAASIATSWPPQLVTPRCF